MNFNLAHKSVERALFGKDINENVSIKIHKKHYITKENGQSFF